MRFFIRRLLIFSIIACSFLGTKPSPAQVILKSREWTNADGKKIQAELLGFDSKSKDGLIRLRLKAGNIFKINPESLSREDQAVILKVRFDRNFRDRYNEEMGAHFFYSKQVPKNDDDKVVAYIGNDHESAWVRLKVSAHAGLVNDGAKILLMSGDSAPLSINYDRDDIDAGRSSSTIDLSLTKYKDTLNSVFSNYDKTKILIETKSGSYTQIKLTTQEKRGLKEVAEAYTTLSTLTTDHVWWTTFQGLDPDEFKKMAERKAMEDAANKAPAKVVNAGPILPLQEWTDERRNETFAAEVAGFDRHLASFTLEGGTPRSIPVVDINREGQEILVSTRRDRAMYKSWHPYDDEYSWYWPKKWTDPEVRIKKQAILYVVNRETGEPGIFLQHKLDTDSAVNIVSCKLKAPKVFLDIDLPAGGRVLKLRGRTSTKVWYHLSGEIAELLLVAAPGIESFEYEITPASGVVQTGKFTDEEFVASIEALEIYRIRKALHKKE